MAGALKRLDEVYGAYAEEDADFLMHLVKEQGELEALIQAKMAQSGERFRACCRRTSPTDWECKNSCAFWW